MLRRLGLGELLIRRGHGSGGEGLALRLVLRAEEGGEIRIPLSALLLSFHFVAFLAAGGLAIAIAVAARLGDDFVDVRDPLEQGLAMLGQAGLV